MIAHNEFFAADAFEYTEVYRTWCNKPIFAIRGKLAELSVRISRREKAGAAVESYRLLLVDYRALEDALAFATDRRLPNVVKIQDSEVHS